MYSPFYFFIGQRYASLKAKNHFISFISIASFLGIALGVAVLIIVMSVMNGFSQQIRKSLLEGMPHLILNPHDESSDWTKAYKELARIPSVTKTLSTVGGQGMLIKQGHMQGILLQGVNFQEASDFYDLQAHRKEGELRLTPGRFEILMSDSLAQHLGFAIGDKVPVVVAQLDRSLSGASPRIKRFTLTGTFALNARFDSAYALIDAQDARRFFRSQDVTLIQVMLKEELEAPLLARVLNDRYAKTFTVQDWTQQHKSFLQAIQMEKLVMMLILFLIVAVAAFNLVSSLVMMVTDKRGDIAILQTLGASPKDIMRIFIFQGTLIGAVGTLIGVSFGLFVASNVTAWYAYLVKVTGLQLIDKGIYFIDFLPSEIHRADVLGVSLVTLILSFLATVYPARRAAAISPSEALRYE